MNRFLASILALVAALFATPTSAQFDGHAEYFTPGYSVFNWAQSCPHSTRALIKLWSPGGSGGGSAWGQWAGAGGSGGYGECLVSRPASGLSDVYVGAGGQSVPAGAIQQGNSGNDTFFDQCIGHSGGGGQAAASANTGGDGGTPGTVGSYPTVILYIPGGMGQASAPALNGINYDMPQGANAPGGGRGSNNGQSGQFPGGGGAPGNSQFPSGAGASGGIYVICGPN